jgi:hypothetical protein
MCWTSIEKKDSMHRYQARDGGWDSLNRYCIEKILCTDIQLDTIQWTEFRRVEYEGSLWTRFDAQSFLEWNLWRGQKYRLWMDFQRHLGGFEWREFGGEN